MGTEWGGARRPVKNAAGRRDAPALERGRPISHHRRMESMIAHVALLVREYDEAIAFFTEKLRFTVVEDTGIDAHKRWVLVAPPGAPGTSLLLARASTEEQSRLIGNQGGGRVFLFLRTDDFRRDYDSMRARGVIFLETPRNEAYGSVAVFQDLYGNRWDLLGPG
jgi:catechol 2,3-dioxygenase-like lactoylglutathione lyase family enzyme